MSDIALADAIAIRDALIAQQVANPMGSIGTITIGGRSTTFRSAADLMKWIDYWRRTVASLERAASGGSRISMVVPNFRDRTG